MSKLTIYQPRTNTSSRLRSEKCLILYVNIAVHSQAAFFMSFLNFSAFALPLSFFFTSVLSKKTEEEK